MKLDSTWVNSYKVWAWLKKIFTCGAFYQPPPPRTFVKAFNDILNFYNSSLIATIRMIVINQIKVISLIKGSQPSMLTGASVSPR